MNLIELATGVRSSEYKVTLVVLIILGCQVLGIDALVILPLILDGGDVIKYEELIKALGTNRTDPGGAAIWALAFIGVAYPAARAYVKKLKTEIIQGDTA